MVVMSVILNGHRPWYHNCTSNLCEVFKNPNSVSPVVKGLYKGVVAQLDMPLGCPIPKVSFDLCYEIFNSIYPIKMLLLGSLSYKGRRSSGGFFPTLYSSEHLQDYPQIFQPN